MLTIMVVMAKMSTAHAASRVFIEQVYGRVATAGYRVENLDVTVLAEKPRLKQFKPQIAIR